MITLRQWRDDDLPAFAEMNADPEVMRFFLKPLTPDESSTFLTYLRTIIAEQGWGLWAVDVGGDLAGFTGLSRPSFSAPFTPCVEIGWRLRRQYWGQGVGTVAARLAERHAFEILQLPELVSFTTAANLRSRKLMERLGFSRDPADDFLHPRVPTDHPLCPHVLYRKPKKSPLDTSVTPPPAPA